MGMTGVTGRDTIRRPRTARGHPVLGYAAVRSATGVGLALLTSILVFAGTQVLPGDAAAAILGRNATPAALAHLRMQLGLDRSLVTQYVSWLTGLLHGHLGNSISAGVPVWSVIGGRLGNSLILAAVALAVMLPLALVLGITAGTRADTATDHVISTSSLFMIALPEFITGTLLVMVFATGLHLLPSISLVAPGSTPLSNPEILILPCLTLVIAGLPYVVRMLRVAVLDAMRADSVELARLNGLTERTVVMRYGLRNALAPTVQVVALTLQWLIGGVVVTETVFNYPGIGQGLVQAVGTRDLPVVQATTMLIAIVYIAIVIAADIAILWLIPKLRTGHVR